MSEPIRTPLLSMLVQRRIIIRAYRREGWERKIKKEKKRRRRRRGTEAWRVVEAQRKIDAYLWDTFSKQVIFAGGRGEYYI